MVVRTPARTPNTAPNPRGGNVDLAKRNTLKAALAAVGALAIATGGGILDYELGGWPFGKKKKINTGGAGGGNAIVGETEQRPVLHKVTEIPTTPIFQEAVAKALGVDPSAISQKSAHLGHDDVAQVESIGWENTKRDTLLVVTTEQRTDELTSPQAFIDKKYRDIGNGRFYSAQFRDLVAIRPTDVVSVSLASMDPSLPYGAPGRLTGYPTDAFQRESALMDVLLGATPQG